MTEAGEESDISGPKREWFIIMLLKILSVVIILYNFALIKF